MIPRCWSCQGGPGWCGLTDFAILVATAAWAIAMFPDQPSPKSRDKQSDGADDLGEAGLSMIKPRTQWERSAVVVDVVVFVAVAVADGDHSGRPRIRPRPPAAIAGLWKRKVRDRGTRPLACCRRT